MDPVIEFPVVISLKDYSNIKKKSMGNLIPRIYTQTTRTSLSLSGTQTLM